MVFVNKMDVVGANFARTLDSIHAPTPTPRAPTATTAGRSRSSSPSAPASARTAATPFRGIIDLIEMKALFFDAGDLGKTVRADDIPADMLAEARQYREQLFDVLTQHDDKDLITSAVLEGSDPDPAKVRQLVREQTLARKI